MVAAQVEKKAAPRRAARNDAGDEEIATRIPAVLFTVDQNL